MQLVNYAAWIPAEKAPLEVATAPFPDIGGHEVIIKNRAVAVNPVDWKIQASGGFGLSYPAVLGEDVAGEVVEVGKKVKGLKKGDRVIAHSLGLGNGSAYGGFQLYPRLKTETVAKIPDKLEFRHAAVLPLSISTAAAGLYLKATLGLDFPQLKSSQIPTSSSTVEDGFSLVELEHDRKKKPALLLWGGSSSVGSSVVQLAVASDYDVVATASPANYSYVKSLGASLVLDYHNPDVVPILISLLKESGTTIAGAYDAIGSDTTVRQSAAVLQALGGGTVASVGAAPGGLPKDVKVARIGSTNIVSQEGGVVAKKIWNEFVPAALEQGVLRPAPEELVVGSGLYFVQGGLDRQKQGVSARKVVITL
jgi:NADPH:quinone reductase-like Zn-dependent oxidoreductase